MKPDVKEKIDWGKIKHDTIMYAVFFAPIVILAGIFYWITGDVAVTVVLTFVTMFVILVAIAAWYYRTMQKAVDTLTVPRKRK